MTQKTIALGPWNVTLSRLDGWTEVEIPHDPALDPSIAQVYAFQTTEHKSSVLVYRTPGTVLKMIADMDAAPQSMERWISVVDRRFVNVGAWTAYRVFVVLNETLLQAQYFYQLPALPEDGGPWLLMFAFAFAHDEEKRADRFDGFFEGMAIAR